jgi:hypothetical protein
MTSLGKLGAGIANYASHLDYAALSLGVVKSHQVQCIETVLVRNVQPWWSFAPVAAGEIQWSESQYYRTAYPFDSQGGEGTPHPLAAHSSGFRAAGRQEYVSTVSVRHPSFNLLSAPETNDALGTDATKNAAAKDCPPHPVFSGIRAEKDKDLSAPSAAIGDSESPDECQHRASAAGAAMLVTYIGAGGVTVTGTIVKRRLLKSYGVAWLKRSGRPGAVGDHAACPRAVRVRFGS